MKYKICFVLFNFGKFPSYFDLWIKNAERNAEYDFLIYTDREIQFDLPANVKIKHITFRKCINRIQKMYDFEITIPEPYKICDFRPAFGEIFKDDIVGYDFWGTMDLDIILGNIENFITDEILDNYDKILTRDHFCLYRNTKKVNEHYKGAQELGEEIYKKVFTTPYVISFGERGPEGVYRIWKYNNWRMYDETICADILPSHYHFEYKVGDEKREKAILFYQDDSGKICGVVKMGEGKYQIKEWMYIHLQKRKLMDLRKDNRGKFKVVIPNKIIACEHVDLDFIKLLEEKYGLDKLCIREALQKWKWKIYKRKCQIHNDWLMKQYKE